jgi:hypothetical protein
MMSFAEVSNLQYRFKEIAGGTLITFAGSSHGYFATGTRAFSSSNQLRTTTI